MDIEKLVADLQDYADGLGAAPIIVHDRAELYGLLARAAAALRSAQVQQVGGLPERDPSKPNSEQGLYRKFDVRRTDGSDAPGGKHHGCEYFVLDVQHDPHALPAITAYANSVERSHPHLAKDLRDSGWAAHPSACELGAVRPNCERLTDIRHCQACGCDFTTLAQAPKEPK